MFPDIVLSSKVSQYIFLYFIIPRPGRIAINRFVPEFTRNHAVIPGHFHLDARNPSRGPTYWPPNFTGFSKIPTARGGNRICASELYHVAAEAGFYRKAVKVCYIPIPTDAQMSLRTCAVSSELSLFPHAEYGSE